MSGDRTINGILVPRGKILLRKAVEQMMRDRLDIPADSRLSINLALRRPDIDRLQEVLAEGDLSATIIDAKGFEHKVPQAYWRLNACLECFGDRSASWQEQVPYGPSITRRGFVLLDEVDFHRWHEPPLTGRTVPDAQALKTWMAAAARESFRSTGEKPFQEVLVKACVAECGCSVRAAADAFRDGVPAELKRGGAETKAQAKPLPL